MNTLKKLIRRLSPLLLVMAFSMMLMACGGGGGDDSGPQTNSNQWDAMTWDHGKWE